MLCNVSSGGGGGILLLYDRTRYTIIYTTKVIQKYMISNVTFSDRTHYTIVYTTKVIRKYMISNVSFSGGGRGLHCFYMIVHAIRLFIHTTKVNVSLGWGQC